MPFSQDFLGWMVEGDTENILRFLNQLEDKEERQMYAGHALRTAAWKGHLHTVKTLYALGDSIVNKNKRNSLGHDALMLACAWNNEEIVRFLLQNDFDPTNVDKKGRTAEDYARLNGHTRIVDILQEYRNSYRNSEH